MKYSRIITFIFLFIFTFSFSQNIGKKSTLIKEIEGITISYEKINNNSDCIFHIDNQSGNSAILSWDIKIYYSETDSKEIHKEYESSAFTKEDKSLFADSKSNTKNTQTSIIDRAIVKIEIHNFEFKSVP